MVYVFKCANPECDIEVYEVEEFYEDGKTYDSRPCPVCQVMGRRVYFAPVVHYKGLGFSKTDDEYEQQLKTAEKIADMSYQKRAEEDIRKNGISKDDSFWQELASHEFQKEVAKGNVYSPPPTTAMPEYEKKASRNIAKNPTTRAYSRKDNVENRKLRKEMKKAKT